MQNTRSTAGVPRRASPDSPTELTTRVIAAGKTQTREGARYRRLARRRGKALVAVGNTQLKVYHKLLSSPGTRYQDLGPDYYERQVSTRRQIAHHVSKLGALGFDVTLCRIPGADPDPNEPGNTQAA